MKFSSVCAPAYLYIIISVIGLFISMSTNVDIITTIINLVIILLWGWFLNFLCIRGYSIIAWLLLILPFIGVFRLLNKS